MGKKVEEVSKLTARVPSAFLRQVHAWAAARGLSVQEVVIAAVRKYIREAK